MKLKKLSEGHWIKADPTKRMSMLLCPSDRDKFIKWGKKKQKNKPHESKMRFLSEW
jgi:hypothetical protein